VYQVVPQHLETWLALAHANAPDGDAMPEDIERDFRH
jgi:hypothetical protein